jgi:3-oxoacyl-[acyl-carrier protein] reductase
MDLGIRNKTALVTGGGGGLGSAIAVALAREGVNVVLADINAAALDAAASAVRATTWRWSMPA